MQQIYCLRDDFFVTLTRRVLAQSFLLSVIVIAVSIFISSHNTGLLSAGILTSIIPLILASVYGIYSSLQRERNAWRSFEIILEGNAITRRISGRPDITLTPDTVNSILEAPNGTLTIRGASINNTIFVPYHLNGLAEVRTVLAQWQSIRSKPASPTTTLNMLAAFAAVLLMAVAFTSQNPAVGAPAALLLVTALLWSAWSIHRSTHLDKRTRRTAWLILLPMAALFVRAYTLLVP